MPDLLIVINEAGTIECVGSSATEAFGYSHGELIGQPVSLILETPDRSTVVKPPFSWMSASTHPTLHGIHRDGHRFPLRLTQHDLHGGQGNHILMLLNRPETTLPDERVFLRHKDLYELAMTQGRISVWEVDYRTNNFEFSPVLGKILGIPDDQVPTTVDGWRGYFHPDDWQAIEAESGRMLTHEIPEISVVSRMRHTDGTTRWVLIRGEAYFDAAGNPLRSLGTVIDISDRRHAEFERDLFFTLTLDMLCVADLQGLFHRLNPSFCKTLGYTNAELEGRPFLEFVHPEDQAATVAATIQLRAGENVTTFENRYRCKDGTYRWLSWKTPAPEPGSDRLYAIARDVTTDRQIQAERMQALAEADQANRAESEFLSRMSHELRTPLNAILGFGQLLQRDTITAKQKRQIDLIVKGGKLLLGLINEVLDISRIEAGKLDISPEPVEVGDLVHEVVNLTQPLSAERGIHITIDDGSLRDCWVHADRQRLRQVLLNLVSNAVKYNADKGQVILSAQATPTGRVCVNVKDTGPGIPAEMHSRLFVPFERLGAEATAIEGSGLGLVLSRRLMEFMGGTLTFVSEVGTGSTFTFELPAGARTQLDTDHLIPDQERDVGQSRDFVLLYIEDNLANVQLIEAVLAFRPGVRHVPATRGATGIDLARQHQPDLILLDVHLPDMRGTEVLGALRADVRTREIPVVVVSADATKHQIEALMQAGASEYLTKPIDVDQFLRVIDRFLARTAV